MKHRKLRIAWSVTCGVATVLMVTLWVRSYWYIHQCFGPAVGEGYVVCGILPGVLFGRVNFDGDSRPAQSIVSMDADDFWSQATEAAPDKRPPFKSKLVGYFRFDRDSFAAPFWFLVAVTIALACASWARFSLRTLLIATTLVAVALGAAIYAMRE